LLKIVICKQNTHKVTTGWKDLILKKMKMKISKHSNKTSKDPISRSYWW